jgi:hypothetical protein
LRALGREVTSFASTWIQLPARLDSVLTRADQGLLSVRSPEVEKGIRRVDGSIRRATSAVIFAVLFGSAIALRLADDELSVWLFAISALPMVHALGLFRLK